MKNRRENMGQEDEQRNITKEQTDKSNIDLNAVDRVFAIAVYLVVWGIALMFMLVFIGEGWHTDFSYAFGPVIAFLIRICGAAVFLSGIFFNIFYGKKIPIMGIVLVFILNVCFFGGILTLDNYAYRTAKFSTEDWIAHPNVRPTLYHDLDSSYNLHGFTEEQVIELLGEPDDIALSDEGVTYKYDDGRRNFTYVDFTNGAADDLYFIN